MIYTGYFAQMKNYKGICLSIARFTPKGINCGTCKHFYPSEQLLKDWKTGLITEEEYKQRYKEETLDKVDWNVFQWILNQYNEDIYLLCYEKPSDFCHRHLVAEWLNEHGIECREKII